MRDKRSFRDGKGVSLRARTEAVPCKPAYKGTERLFFLLWHKSPYMWYTDREQKYKNMLSITDVLLFHRRESEALWKRKKNCSG